MVPSTTTKDGDLSLTPSLVADSPLLVDAMRGAGFRPLGELEAERFEGARQKYAAQPGLWATGISDNGIPEGEVDLIVPTSISGGGRRSPRLLNHHGKVASRTAPGIELAVLDRSLEAFEDFETGSVRPAYVAGHAGLICAKAYKLAERIIDRDATGRNRVLAKDAGDLWRLLATSNGRDVRSTFEAETADPTWGDAVITGLSHVEMLVTSNELAALAIDALEPDLTPDDIDTVIDRWAGAFLG
ncbi:hypothetical protein [Myceligenerans crystallogenes]|uniref:hypothetical protein n=1 Tax=Myceligenerans crystallogenes TaxID=316335 RepID=UPI0031E11AEA